MHWPRLIRTSNAEPPVNIPDQPDVARDNEGYLLDPAQWTPVLAQQIALEESIELTPYHWSLIHYIREYFDARQTVPQARFALKHLSRELGSDKGTRRFLYQLFPYGYGQQACKIAGMRKPLKLMLDV